MARALPSQATEMARHMVAQCGLNDAVGPVYVSDEKLLGEELKQKIDAEVREMLVEARSAAKTLLADKIKVMPSLGPEPRCVAGVLAGAFNPHCMTSSSLGAHFVAQVALNNVF